MASRSTPAAVFSRNHDGLALQLRTKGALTRDVEGVDVNERCPLHPPAWKISHQMQKRASEAMEAARDKAPDAQFGKLRDNHIGICRILGSEPHAAVLQPQSLDGQLPVDDGDHDIAVGRCQRPVHDQLVAVRDAAPSMECPDTLTRNVLVMSLVRCLFTSAAGEVVLGGRWEAGRLQQQDSTGARAGPRSAHRERRQRQHSSACYLVGIFFGGMINRLAKTMSAAVFAVGASVAMAVPAHAGTDLRASTAGA